MVVATLFPAVNATLTVPPLVPDPLALYAHSSSSAGLPKASELTRTGVPLIAVPDTELTPRLVLDPWR